MVHARQPLPCEAKPDCHLLDQTDHPSQDGRRELYQVQRHRDKLLAETHAQKATEQEETLSQAFLFYCNQYYLHYSFN